MKEWVADWDALKATDPEVADALVGELERERSTIRLIASENFTSPAVLAALASTMNNKYAEGLPGKRYYGGCRWVDVVEELAIERAKELFGAEHANVLAMGARIVAPSLAREILEVWLDTEFEGGRHRRRVEQIGEIEAEEASR